MLKFREWFRQKNGFCAPGGPWGYLPGEHIETSVKRLMNGVADYLDEAVAEMQTRTSAAKGDDNKRV